MHAAVLRRPARAAMIAALVLALGAVLAFALFSGGTRTAQAAVRHAAKHATHHSTKHATHFVALHPRHRAAAKGADPAGPSDGDNVQSGDQTTPDSPSAGTGGETTGESSETGGEAPGDQQPAGGGAGVQGECTGDCVQ